MCPFRVLKTMMPCQVLCRSRKIGIHDNSIPYFSGEKLRFLLNHLLLLFRRGSVKRIKEFSETPIIFVSGSKSFREFRKASGPSEQQRLPVHQDSRSLLLITVLPSFIQRIQYFLDAK